MDHIGVVEDTDLVRELLVDVLSDRGYQVTACATLAEARDAFLISPPDLLVTDIRLPDGDGLDFLGELRRLHPAEAFPVLVLSGMGAERDLTRGFDAGASDYLTKPLSPPELLAKCSVLLARTRARTQVRTQSPSRVFSAVGEDLPGGRHKAFGRYRIEGVLGRGGVGVVYAATDLKEDRRVALKVLSSISCLKEEARKRFIRETYALSQVHHPSVVSVFDFGSTEGRMFFAMELVDGPTLAEKIGAEGTATEAQVVELLVPLVGALEQLGQAQLVHRDIKPENVILRDGRYDRPVLVDFGLAKQTFDRSLTLTGNLVGTPAYMAPEMIRGEPVDARADLFCLGLVARFACTGTDVFPDHDCMALLRAIASQPIPIPSCLSDSLGEVLRRLTCSKPEERYASAADLSHALTRQSSAFAQPA